MKKIIIAILLVFSCGIFALTIPKSANAQTVLTDNDLSIDIGGYDGEYYYYNINTMPTLIFYKPNSNERLYLNTIELEFYTYIDYGLDGAGQPTNVKYLYCVIESVYFEVEYFNLSESVGIYSFTLLAEQNEELRFNTLISVTEFENVSREPSNLFFTGLTSNLITVGTDGIVEVVFSISIMRDNEDLINYHDYFYQWEPFSDSGLQVSFDGLLSNLGFNNIIPPNIQAYLNRYELITHVRQNVTPFPEGDLTSWITNAVSPILNFQIFPGFSLALILGIILAFGLLFMILKLFAGG